MLKQYQRACMHGSDKAGAALPVARTPHGSSVLLSLWQQAGHRTQNLRPGRGRAARPRTGSAPRFCVVERPLPHACAAATPRMHGAARTLSAQSPHLAHSHGQPRGAGTSVQLDRSGTAPVHGGVGTLNPVSGTLCRAPAYVHAQAPPAGLRTEAGCLQTPLGVFQQIQTCGRCDGTGESSTPCSTCGGDGRVRRNKSIEVRVPAGGSAQVHAGATPPASGFGSSHPSPRAGVPAADASGPVPRALLLTCLGSVSAQPTQPSLLVAVQPDPSSPKAGLCHAQLRIGRALQPVACCVLDHDTLQWS